MRKSYHFLIINISLNPGETVWDLCLIKGITYTVVANSEIMVMYDLPGLKGEISLTDCFIEFLKYVLLLSTNKTKLIFLDIYGLNLLGITKTQPD